MSVPPSPLLPPAVAATLFWASVAACVVAQGFIIRAAFRAVRPPTEAAPVPAPHRGAELVWAVLPAFALAALWLGAWRALSS
ncbi:MAG: hypothetical protein KJT01_11365 [Gemmatimonadetes bacterium]|nr:hypothetical protein [Gemmatimonadota bacterium]